MIKKIFSVIILMVTIVACDKDDPFLVTQNQVGPITRETKIEELEALFTQDSVVEAESAGPGTKALEIYDREGNQMLSITPDADSVQQIKSIQIFDPRYTTDAGINLTSTFKDIDEAYSIEKIETMLSSVLVFVNEIDAYFTIDKKELPSDLRYDYEAKIEKAQIPDEAKIKYFIVGW